MICRIFYPSGLRFEVDGELEVIVKARDDPQVIAVHVLAPGDRSRAYLLDPRAVVVGPTGTRLYDPRRAQADGLYFDAAFETWLTEHPEWPRVMEEN